MDNDIIGTYNFNIIEILIYPDIIDFHYSRKDGFIIRITNPASTYSQIKYDVKRFIKRPCTYTLEVISKCKIFIFIYIIVNLIFIPLNCIGMKFGLSSRNIYVASYGTSSPKIRLLGHVVDTFPDHVKPAEQCVSSLFY